MVSLEHLLDGRYPSYKKRSVKIILAINIMYRVVIASVQPSASRQIYQLRAELIKQFLHSPLCSTVVVKRNPVILDETLQNIKHEKLRTVESMQGMITGDVRNLFVAPHVLEVQGDDLSHAHSVVVFDSIFRPNEEVKKQLQVLSRRQPSVRPSIFLTGHIAPQEDDNITNIPSSVLERVTNFMYPIGSQFLSARCREIEPKHLALAVRLNYETCESSAGLDGIEELDYVDCMKIIGLDERI